MHLENTVCWFNFFKCDWVGLVYGSDAFRSLDQSRRIKIQEKVDSALTAISV